MSKWVGKHRAAVDRAFRFHTPCCCRHCCHTELRAVWSSGHSVAVVMFRLFDGSGWQWGVCWARVSHFHIYPCCGCHRPFSISNADLAVLVAVTVFRLFGSGGRGQVKQQEVAMAGHILFSHTQLPLPLLCQALGVQHYGKSYENIKSTAASATLCSTHLLTCPLFSSLWLIPASWLCGKLATCSDLAAVSWQRRLGGGKMAHKMRSEVSYMPIQASVFIFIKNFKVPNKCLKRQEWDIN